MKRFISAFLFLFLVSLISSAFLSAQEKGRVLTVGEYGKFKGVDGFQMAFNMAQDMDEIKIEQGIIGCSGLIIPKNKKWEHGIKISGGWNESFGEQIKNPEATILDGGGKESNILTISNSKGTVSVENLKFRNSKTTAVKAKTRLVSFTKCIFSSCGGCAVELDNNVKGTFTNCTFTNNSNTYSSGDTGGAVYISKYSGEGTFTNCTFTNNSNPGIVGNGGGAVYGGGRFTNCKFTNNSAHDGGAVYGGGTFTDCKFTNNSSYGRWDRGGGAVDEGGTFANCSFVGNSASNAGGAVNGEGTFVTCTFYGNKAEEGGAVYGGGKCLNSIFYNNVTGGKNNDIMVPGDLEIDYCLINVLKGAANFGSHNIMGDPKFLNPEKGDLHLRPDSPCIDAGILPLPQGFKMSWFKMPSTDLDGKPRIVGGKIDMGAFEHQKKR